MPKTRAVTAPRQDESRVVVLGLVLFPDRVTLHAVVDDDPPDIEEPCRELDRQGMFFLADDVGTRYEVRSGEFFAAPGRQRRDWTVTIDPPAPAEATRFLVTHADGGVELIS
jgi:hypothetical protein